MNPELYNVKGEEGLEGEKIERTRILSSSGWDAMVLLVWEDIMGQLRVCEQASTLELWLSFIPRTWFCYGKTSLADARFASDGVVVCSFRVIGWADQW